MAARKRVKEVVEPAATVEPGFVPLPEIQTKAVEPMYDAPPPESEFILVKAVGSNQYEPFQRIAIPADHAVPVKRSNWVTVQLRAGVISLA